MKIILTILSILLLACSSPKTEIPTEILSETEFTNILKEVHLAEAAFELNKREEILNPRNNLANSYQSIYNKYDIDGSTFSNSLNYYAKHPEILDSLNEINEEKYHQILIQNTVPLSHYDLEENKSLLLENNFENLNSISWDKGCYVGQEITARMKYRALLKKKIYSLEIKEGSPLIGQVIKDDENEFGKIISIKNDSVLAMLKIELAEIKINTKKQIKTNEGLVLEFIF